MLMGHKDIETTIEACARRRGFDDRLAKPIDSADAGTVKGERHSSHTQRNHDEILGRADVKTV